MARSTLASRRSALKGSASRRLGRLQLGTPYRGRPNLQAARRGAAALRERRALMDGAG